MKRSPLKRGSKPLRRRTPLRPVGSRARRHSERMDELRPVVFARAFWRCEVQVDGVCNGTADQAHHVLPRSAGGPDTLENLIAVCAPSEHTGRAGCHRYIHANPTWARERGWLRSRYGRRIA